MEGLSIEQKAKAYDKALEVLHKYDGANIMFTQDLKEEMFPALKESEDEKMKREITGILRNAYWTSNRDRFNELVAWLEKKDEKFQYWKPSEEQLEALDYAYNLCPDTERGNYYEGVLGTIIEDLHKLSEKQGEQKPADKVKPKFNVGDWVIDKQNIVHQIANVIENVTNHIYGYDIVGGGYFNDNTEGVKLWTIQDAKDGDILVYCGNPGAHQIEVIMLFKAQRNESSLFTYFYIFDNYYRVNDWCGYNEKVHPATKEQRYLLFQKMKEAGYEWDAEKKELKKIEQKYWSEEDEKMIDSIIDYMKPMPIFFESTKGKSGKEYTKAFIKDATKWLKSLSHKTGSQKHWRPSNEQIKTLNKVIFCTYNANNIEDRKHIESLYNNLKKLTEG